MNAHSNPIKNPMNQMKKIGITIGVGALGLLLAVVLLRGNFGGQHATGARPAPAPATAEFSGPVKTESADVSRALQPAATSDPDDEQPAIESLPRDFNPASSESNEGLRRLWAGTDPAAAANWAAQNGPGASATLRFAAAAWASTNLPAALNWIATLPEGDPKTLASMAVAYEAARTDPLTALRLARPLLASRERDDLLACAVSQWAQTDNDAATAWVAQVPDASLKQHLFAAAAIALAGKDGAAAATLAGTVLSPGAEQDRTAVSIVQVWAQTAPQSAANWVLQFPTTLRVAAVRSLIPIWTLRDATAAASWLNALPVGPDHDAGQAAYTQAMASLASAIN